MRSPGGVPTLGSPGGGVPTLRSPRGGGPRGAIMGGGGPRGAIVGGGMPAHVEMMNTQGPPSGFYDPEYMAGPPTGVYPPEHMAGPPTGFYPPEHMAEQDGRPKPRIKENRRCRDIPFLVVFLVFLLGMLINSSWGWNKGSPRRLLYGTDYNGHICDKDYDVKYWLNPNQLYDSGLKNNSFNILNARSICLKNCPKPSSTNGSLAWVCDYPEGPITLSKKQWAHQNYDYYSNLTSVQQKSSLNLTGPCYPVLFASTNFFWTCQLQASPDNQSLAEWQTLGGVSVNQGEVIVKGIQDLLSKPGQIFKRYIADLGHAWAVLLVCGGIAPFLLSLVWLVLIRLFVGVVIWTSLVILNLATIAVTVWFYIKAGWIGSDAITPIIGDKAADDLSLQTSHSEQNHLKILAVIMTIVSVIVLLITLLLIKRVFLAVAVLKVSTKSIAAIPSLVIYPIFPTVILAVFFILWLSVLLYLFSAGEIRQNTCQDGCCAYDLSTQTMNCNGCCGYKFHHSKNVAWAILYHIFGGFWVAQFIIACSLTIVAGAVASYYWVRGDTSALPTFTLLSSVKRLLRYSLGSMAVGSFLVAVIEMVRFILEAIRNRLRILEAAPGGCCISILCCCAGCCLGCIESTIKFINRNAYIVIATKGKGFFGAAVKASSLIVNNILRVATVNILTDMVLFLGKLSVGALSTFFAFLMLEEHHYKSGNSKVSSPLFPILATWVLSYTIAKLFFGVVEISVDTILLSYCIDCEENHGTALYAPPLLLDVLNRHTRSEEEKEARKGKQ